uniref:C1q domain-containing protein n=1 Tax=Pygocentrus nattereri TaxID=42514 RepID=A0A3B4CI22_PYGNA
MVKTATAVLSALLLCVGGALAQDFMSPTVNIMEELGKLKNMEERLRTLEETVQNQRVLVEQLQKENEDRKVAFSASLLAFGSGYTGPFSSVTSPLIYKKVVTNYGNGYDSNTGIFTAPLKGVYYFRFYAHCHTGNQMAVSLYKNDKVQCSVFSERPWTNGNASNGIVLILEKGDQIYTKLWDKSWVYDDHESYTSFGGFLLFPL